MTIHLLPKLDYDKKQSSSLPAFKKKPHLIHHHPSFFRFLSSRITGGREKAQTNPRTHNNDVAVGKTSMLHSLVKGEPPLEYIPTVFDNFETDKVIDEKTCHLTLWDTAGQEEYNNIRPLSYPETNIFLVCFSVEAQSSFDNIAAKWLPELKKHEPNTPFIVVGTKCDVRENADIVAERLALGKPMKPYEEYKELALQNGAAAYVECSAITRANLESLFDDAIRIVRKMQAARPIPEKKQLRSATSNTGAGNQSTNGGAGGSGANGGGGGCCSTM